MLGGIAIDAAPQNPADDVATGARSFYERMVALRTSGVPDARQRRQLEPVVSLALSRALRAASDAERRHAKATRNREPPLWEGNIFSSLFEGPGSARVERCQAEGANAQCVVSLSYRDFFGAEQRWQDRAVLVRERQRWVVDDVAFGATWAFGNKGTLRGNLSAIADAYKPEARPARPKHGRGRASAGAKASRGRGK